MNVTIEAMVPSDYEAVYKLWQVTEGVGLGESDSEHAICRYLARNEGLSLVARAQGEIVGAVLCGHDGRRGYLHHLAVDKRFRGRGYGKQLVEKCLTQLRELRIEKCNIFVYSTHQEGQAFWAGLGWMRRVDLEVVQKSL